MVGLSVIIVTWNCRQLLAECLRSLHLADDEGMEVIVVDNASTDGTADDIKANFPAVHFIANDENLGFAAANNIGLRASHGRYVALINPDVVVLPGCLSTLTDVLDQDDTVGLAGPCMLGSDGTVRRSGMRLPSPWRAFCDAFLLHKLFGSHPLFGGQMMHDFDWTSRRDVDVLNGWFWMVRREALNHVGPLDERFFMYGEDVDWCKRFGDAGWRIVFEPRAQAIHYGGGSSQNAPLRFYLELEKAKRQYWTKHHRLSWRLAYWIVRNLHHGMRVVGYGALCLAQPGDTQLRFKVRRHALCLGPFTSALHAGAAGVRD